MCDIGDKLLNGIKSVYAQYVCMYLYSLTYVRVKGVESGRYFKRQTCLITLVFPCARGWGNERSVNEDGSEISSGEESIEITGQERSML